MTNSQSFNELYKLCQEARSKIAFKNIVIYTHPNSFRKMQEQNGDLFDSFEKPLIEFCGIPIVVTEYCPEEFKTGHYILPDGSVVPPEKVKVRDGFWEWQPHHIKVLLWWGIIKEHTVPYMVCDSSVLPTINTLEIPIDSVLEEYRKKLWGRVMRKVENDMLTFFKVSPTFHSTAIS